MASRNIVILSSGHSIATFTKKEDEKNIYLRAFKEKMQNVIKFPQKMSVNS
jgi:hypothetical protein